MSNYAARHFRDGTAGGKKVGEFQSVGVIAIPHFLFRSPLL
jgi:hypothetical protein